MTAPDYGEAGFNAQDDRPFGIQGSDDAEMARLDDLERRWADAGCDLFGFPLPEAAS